MTNEEFQKIVLQELKSLRTDVNEIKAEQKSMSVRQDEIYQVAFNFIMQVDGFLDLREQHIFKHAAPVDQVLIQVK